MEEVQERRKALKIAKEVAKKHKGHHIVSDGEFIDVDDC
jgi:hypothetical protein